MGIGEETCPKGINIFKITTADFPELGKDTSLHTEHLGYQTGKISSYQN